MSKRFRSSFAAPTGFVASVTRIKSRPTLCSAMVVSPPRVATPATSDAALILQAA